MCDCGNARTAVRQAARQTQWSAPAQDMRVTRSAGKEFEYTGHAQLAVTGPLTGTRYHFGGHGARVLVHASDVPSLALVPHLVPVL